jgi:hypothetical protein
MISGGFALEVGSGFAVLGNICPPSFEESPFQVLTASG